MRYLLGYVDERELVMKPLSCAARSMGAGDRRVVAGGETTGITYAALVAQSVGAPMIYVRKKPKEFGGKNQIEGHHVPGTEAILIEDTT